MKQITIQAEKTNLPKVVAFIEEQLEQIGCGFKTLTQIEMAVEEIFVNIASYAYAPDTGDATITLDISEDPPSVTISFIDSGTPYDPLAAPDPDMKVSIKERKKGGLGILMVKRSMDDLSYEYKDNKNILTIKKTIV